MARAVALEVLLKYWNEQSYLNITLNEYLQNRDLSRNDKDLATRIVYGTIQNKIYLEYQLEPYIKDKKVKNRERLILLMSLYQLIFLDKIPSYGIIDEAVKLAKNKNLYAGKFVNAVLRNYLRNGKRNIDEADELKRLSIETSHPLWMVKMLSKQYGLEVTKKICFHDNMPPVRAARVNTLKINKEEQLKEILKIAKQNKIPLTIIGNGSNILVSDDGIKGITLMINIEGIEIEEKKENVEIIAGAGEKIGKLARVFLKRDISGFEELSGIPGTLGGAVRMNAGAHGKEMKDIIKGVKCIDYNGKEKILTTEEMQFDYRKSMLVNNKYIVTKVKIELQKGKEEEIKEKMDNYAKYRREKQPIEYPNAGSTFKRGKDFITAKLIDEAGLKGYSIGGAEVSTKHSGFIVNKGNATAKDVLQLTKYIEEEVYKKFNKKIELEIELVGN